jgi:hypothetical protein
MVVHVMAEGAVAPHGPVPMHPKSIRCREVRVGGDVGSRRLLVSRLLGSRRTIRLGGRRL